MTNPITFHGTLSASDAGRREITGLMLPYGSVGYTSAGAVTASAGSVTLPEDPSEIHLNIEHDFRAPVGRAVSFSEGEDGITATFRISRTSRGDDLLAEVADGLRAALSVEVDDVTISDGALTAGRLSGVAAVVRPAFADARITELAASEADKENNTETTDAPTGAEKGSRMDTVDNAPAVEQAAPLTASAERHDLGRATYSALSEGRSLEAALNVVLPEHDAAKAYIRDQEVGELWEAWKAERPLVEKVGVRPLDGLVITGHKRTRGFKMQDWAGSPTELPTGEVIKTTREYWNAEAKAGAVRISMEVLEFGGESVVSDLLEDAHRHYVTESEAELVEALRAEATPVTALDTPVQSINAALAQLGSIGARGSAIVVAPNVFAALSNLTASEVPWWFSGSASMHSQTLTAGDISLTTHGDLEAGEILVMDTRAVDYRESKDFRYRAVDVGTAGTDIAAVKFRAVKVTDPGAVLLVSAGA